MGYLDDAAYAARLAARAVEDRPMGRRRLVEELARRGVDRDTIERTLGQCFGPEQERQALARALAKATRGGTAAAAPAGVRKVAAFLLRRGFGRAQVLAAVRVWREGAAADEPEAWDEGQEMEEEHEE